MTPVEQSTPTDPDPFARAAHDEAAPPRPVPPVAAAEFRALQARDRAGLRGLAEAEGLPAAADLGRDELLLALLAHRRQLPGLRYASGVLDLAPDGYGFLRAAARDCLPGPDDVYVTPGQVRHLHLRHGNELLGPVRPARPGEQHATLLHVDVADGADAADLRTRAPFGSRVPILPTRRLRLAPGPAPFAARAIDLLAPWARGHRVLLACPAGADRTGLLRELAAALGAAEPEVHVLLGLLDQEPERLTELRRALAGPRCELAAATFDAPPGRQLALAELALARAERLVEAGRDVVLFVDSLTALARAGHLALPPTGRQLCAGLDAGAVLRSKRAFARARQCEEGGSLTLVATVIAGGDSGVDRMVRAELRQHANSEAVFVAAAAGPGAGLLLDVQRTATRAEDLPLPADACAGLQRRRERLLALAPDAARAAVESELGRGPA
ncbi:MAG: hypothetical protein FJ265_01565 [Planctomycetes bacterium]|nr:hypothetical protein [Planctomycetota bacterium]